MGICCNTTMFFQAWGEPEAWGTQAGLMLAAGCAGKGAAAQ